MKINEEVTLSNLWWNNGLRGFLFRDQATETLEELVSAVGGNRDPNAFSELEDRIEQNYADVEDFEEDCYSESVEYLLENLGYEVEDDDDDEDIEGVGAVHTVITGEVVGVEWRNHSLYGNSSYWVYIKRDNGQFVKAYTAPNSSLAYQVERLPGNIVSFDATIRKDGGVVLNNTVGYEWESHRK